MIGDKPSKGMTKEQEEELEESFNACHSHLNSTTLAQITEPYTTEDAEELNTAFNKAHEHSNSTILANTTESYTFADSARLTSAFNYSHEHSNKSILDTTSASYTTTDKNSLDSNSSKAHTHSNSSTLSAITAAFTTAMKTVVNNLISGIVTTGLSISGYTQLGTSSPSIKQVLITGTTPALGVTQTYYTGIAKEKIISFCSLVSDSGGALRLPFWGDKDFNQEYYFACMNADGRLSISVPSTAGSVHGCGFTCLITYKE